MVARTSSKDKDTVMNAREEEVEARILTLRARTALAANRDSRDILPRWVYEQAGVDVPSNATDEWQRIPGKRHWWQRKSA